MILLDTTVLVYAKGQHHYLRDPCLQLVDAIAEGQIEATTTVEVIQEFVQVRSRRRDRSDAAALGRDYAELLSPLLSPSAQDLYDGLALYERSRGIGAFDAVLVAAAARAGISTLVSADTAFAGVSQVAHVVPDATGLRTLLTA